MRFIIARLNTDIIRNRLEEMMNDEQIYKDMDLIYSFGGQASPITQHSLSQSSTTNDGQFRNYVNGYRVREARRLCHNGKWHFIICYEVGFNS